MKLTPKNWHDFQHYKDRNPPWIKLHKNILDDYDWWNLPVASRALAPCLWLLASCYDGGIFDASLNVLAFRFRMSEKEVEAAITPLINKGYFIIASGMLADYKQDAMPEKRREEKSRHCAVKILDYLNLQSGKNYYPTDTNLEFIVGRLKEGFTEQDCIRVIDTKVADWLNDGERNKYLRPATLFNATKFSQYSGELPMTKKPKVLAL